METSLSPDLFKPLLNQNGDEFSFQKENFSFRQEAWRKLKSDKMAMSGIFILFFIACVAAIGPFLTSYTYYDTNLAIKNLPPSTTHWFGTDDLGRDLFTRNCYGARISLFVGICAAIIDLIVGVLWGSIAAFASGKIGNTMMRIADILYGLPYLLIVILLMVVMGSGIIPLLTAMCIIGWITMARIVRSQILVTKELEFVQASKALGGGFFHILFKHLIPNAIGPIIVTMTLTIPSAIFVEAFLSFLGLGIQAPIASWGTMAHEGLPAIKYYPWRLFFPGLSISLTIFGFNMLGDGLKIALDPLARKSS